VDDSDMHGNCWEIARVDCEVAFGVLWREGSVSNFHLSGGGLVILQKGKTKLPKYQCTLEQESNVEPSSNPPSPLQVVCSYYSQRMTKKGVCTRSENENLAYTT